MRDFDSKPLPLDQADGTPNYIFKSAQARQLAESLLRAADVIDGKIAG